MPTQRNCTACREVSKTAGLSKEWYRDVADLAWKEYFRREREGDAFTNYSHMAPRLFDTCGTIYTSKCTGLDQRIIRAYYDRKWGDGIFALEEFAEQEGISSGACWHTIRWARRALMIRVQLLERTNRNTQNGQDEIRGGLLR